MQLLTVEADILLHRLESGCVEDVLYEEHEDDIDYLELVGVVDRMRKYIINHHALPDISALTPIDKEILEDCITGSTWYAVTVSDYAQEHVSKKHLLDQVSALTILERKISIYIGKHVRAAKW